MRYAAPARTQVTPADEPDMLTVEVVDGGRSDQSVVTFGTGHGIAGMRERATAVGGTLHAGPADDGFCIRAELPLNSDLG